MRYDVCVCVWLDCCCDGCDGVKKISKEERRVEKKRAES